MKVLVIESCQGPGGAHLQAGDIVDLPENEAGEVLRMRRVTAEAEAIKAAEAAKAEAEAPKAKK